MRSSVKLKNSRNEKKRIIGETFIVFKGREQRKKIMLLI